MRTNHCILKHKGLNCYQNENFIGKGSPIEYTWVKEIEDFSKKVHMKIWLVL